MVGWWYPDWIIYGLLITFSLNFCCGCCAADSSTRATKNSGASDGFSHLWVIKIDRTEFHPSAWKRRPVVRARSADVGAFMTVWAIAHRPSAFCGHMVSSGPCSVNTHPWICEWNERMGPFKLSLELLGAVPRSEPYSGPSWSMLSAWAPMAVSSERNPFKQSQAYQPRRKPCYLLCSWLCIGVGKKIVSGNPVEKWRV